MESSSFQGSSGDQADSECARLYAERCDQLFNSRWLDVEARCIHQVPEDTNSEAESTVRFVL